MDQEFLEEVYAALDHARLFIQTKEKMHPDGVSLHHATRDKVLRKIMEMKGGSETW